MNHTAVTHALILVNTLKMLILRGSLATGEFGLTAGPH
jgi:hypothetical protein